MFHWDNRKLPILQLGDDFYDEVSPAIFPEHSLRYANPHIGIEHQAQHFAAFNALPENLQTPLALRYHGHQFQHYNPQLGDGRGFLFAQIQQNKQWYDFGTKGSGQTPYSRNGDGRLTLKGGVREALATEMLQSLGVCTSKTFCIYETGEQLERNDEPSPTRSCVLTRFSLGHIRIGTFQRLLFLQQPENIKKLTSYCLFFYDQKKYLQIDPADDNLIASLFLQSVVEKCARLAASVMISGFVHGVLNTDNINISGELFDYGPYRFLPQYDPNFTAAYFDQQGLYCYGRQPYSFLWALHQLAGSLKYAYPDLATESILENFSDEFNSALQEYFCKRLNIKHSTQNETADLISQFFQDLEKSGLKFESFFYELHSLRVFSNSSLQLKYEKLAPDLLRKLEKFEVAQPNKAHDSYFQQEQPETLLIDEIESIWEPIATQNDWNRFNNKLTSIRKFRGLYE